MKTTIINSANIQIRVEVVRLDGTVARTVRLDAGFSAVISADAAAGETIRIVRA